MAGLGGWEARAIIKSIKPLPCVATASEGWGIKWEEHDDPPAAEKFQSFAGVPSSPLRHLKRDRSNDSLFLLRVDSPSFAV